MFKHIDFERADMNNDIEWFKENYLKYKTEILLHKLSTIYDYPNFDKWLISIGEGDALRNLEWSFLKVPDISGPPNTPREKKYNNSAESETISTPSPCLSSSTSSSRDLNSSLILMGDSINSLSNKPIK